MVEMKRTTSLIFLLSALILIGIVSGTLFGVDAEEPVSSQSLDPLPFDWTRDQIRPYVIPEIDIAFQYPKQWNGPRIEWLQTGKAYVFMKRDTDVFRLSHELYYPQQLTSEATIDQLAAFLKEDMPAVEQRVISVGGLQWIQTYGKDDVGTFIQYVTLRPMGEQGNMLSLRTYLANVEEAVAAHILTTMTQVR